MTVRNRRYELSDPTPIGEQKPPRKRTIKGRGWTYRVGWQRRTPDGLLRPKYKHFHTFGPAIRFFRMFGPAPWRYFRNPMEPDERWPCRECDDGTRRISRKDWNTGREWLERVDCEKCYGGVTVRDYIRLRRLELPEIVWIRFERRPVGAWEGVDAEWEDEAGATNGALTIRHESSAARALREALMEEQDNPL